MSNRIDYLRWSPLFLLLLAGIGGCQRASTAKIAPKDMDNLNQIGGAYLECLSKKGKPPANEADLRPFLLARGDADALLRSSEDGQPYVILWGVDYRKIAVKRMPPPIIAYQKDGNEGRRFVLTVMGVEPLSQDEFDKADFIGPKPK